MRAGGQQTHWGTRNLTSGIPFLGEHHQPTVIFYERFQCEHACWDPKDGELCLNKVKPEEIIVEARSDNDMQIIC